MIDGRDVPPLSALEYVKRIENFLSKINSDEYFDYRLYRFLPRPGWRSLREGTGYFRVDITGRRSLNQLATMPKDVVYVIDTSGSVTQAWVDAALTGIKDALGSLNKSDRFNIVLFKESPVFFHPDRIQLATHKTVAEAEQFLTKTKSGGYTDINRALNRLLVRDTERERVYELILIFSIFLIFFFSFIFLTYIFFTTRLHLLYKPFLH